MNKIMRSRMVLLVGIISMFQTSAFALKPTPSQEIADIKINSQTGTVQALYDLDEPTTGANPEERALDFINTHQDLLGFGNKLSQIKYRLTQETPGGARVHLTQWFNGLEVAHSEIVVSMDRDGHVRFVMSDYQRIDGPATPSGSRAMTATMALQHVKTVLGLADAKALKVDSKISVQNGLAAKAFQMTLDSPTKGSYDVIADAFSGDVIESKSLTVYAHALDNEVTGKGLVFKVAPTILSSALYGTGDLVDGDDADNPLLTKLAEEVPLTLTRKSDGKIYLENKYAKVTDHDSPNDGTFEQASADFEYTRHAGAFEAVNGLYHIGQSMQYINEGLGFKVMPTQYAEGVHFDPHGMSGDDNSSYSGATGALQFGQGGVDDAEDPDVLLHELGHGIHDWITHGGLSNNEGLSEGCGDYWASSFDRTFMADPKNPNFNFVFSWDGHNPFWPGRVNNYTAKYPKGLTGTIHTDGQIWASALMRIWDVAGKRVTDSLFLEALSMLTSSAKQKDAAMAFIKADTTLFKGVHLDLINRVFKDVGYVK